MGFKITKIAPLLIEDWEKKFLEEQKQSLTPAYKHKFRLYDGDGILYFQGLSTHTGIFDPLDFFGTRYGCTDIKYLEDGKFIAL